MGQIEKNNPENFSIEEIYKMKRQEIEKAFQLENLKQMEEKAKKKEIEKQLNAIEQEIDEQKINNNKKKIEERILEESIKKEIDSRNLQETNTNLMRKKIELEKLKKTEQKKKKQETPEILNFSVNPTEINEEVSQNMQNIITKEIKKLRNDLIYHQNTLNGEILGIRVRYKI